MGNRHGCTRYSNSHRARQITTSTANPGLVLAMRCAYPGGGEHARTAITYASIFLSLRPFLTYRPGSATTSSNNSTHKPDARKGHNLILRREQQALKKAIGWSLLNQPLDVIVPGPHDASLPPVTAVAECCRAFLISVTQGCWDRRVSVLCSVL